MRFSFGLITLTLRIDVSSLQRVGNRDKKKVIARSNARTGITDASVDAE